MAKKLLFLDLEDTIITPVMNGWLNCHVINLEKIRAFMQEMQPDELHIFSFAVHTDWDAKLFSSHLRPIIEERLGSPIKTVPTVEDIKAAACSLKMLSVDYVLFSDMSEFWGKQEAFRLYVRHQFAGDPGGVEVALLDDAVEDEDFSFPRLNLSGVVRNIDLL